MWRLFLEAVIYSFLLCAPQPQMNYHFISTHQCCIGCLSYQTLLYLESFL